MQVSYSSVSFGLQEPKATASSLPLIMHAVTKPNVAPNHHRTLQATMPTPPPAAASSQPFYSCPSGIFINEIAYNDGSNDFIELAGPAGATVEGFTFLLINLNSAGQNALRAGTGSAEKLFPDGLDTEPIVSETGSTLGTRVKTFSGGKRTPRLRTFSAIA